MPKRSTNTILRGRYLHLRKSQYRIKRGQSFRLQEPCGLRIAEPCGLTWENIDLENRTITVNHQITIHEDTLRESNAPMRSWYITDTKTASSCRTIPFGETLYQALKAEKNTQAKMRYDAADSMLYSL